MEQGGHDDEVSFEDFGELPPQAAALLPHNYLPAALPAITGDPAAQNRIVLALPDSGRKLLPRYAVIGVRTLQSPQATVEFIRALELGLDMEGGGLRCFLGPVTTLPESAPGAFSQIIAAPVDDGNDQPCDAAVVIIDAGIGFWNQRFRTPLGPRFRELRFLSFNMAGSGMTPGDILTQRELADLCDLADAQGDRAVMAALRAAQPGSFYGAAHGQSPDALWHGTAVADLAAGMDGADPAQIAIYGIELPLAVLRDSDGDALTAVLATALDVALTMTQPVAHKPLVVVLPFGFATGPQDGTHPAAIAIGNALAASRGRQVTLVVPAGNHLQDRCRAKLPPAQPGVPPLTVEWHVPPDDFSSNQIEVLIDNVADDDDRACLVMTPPGAAAASVPGLKAQQFALIKRQGRPVGMVMRYPSMNLRARLRLALAPTGFDPKGGMTAPHGVWQLATLSPQGADLWVLRDDRDLVADGPYPRRMSYFDHIMYTDTDATGAPELQDDPSCPVMRSGTLSVLATAPGAVTVQADEMFGTGPRRQASYSGRRDDGANIAVTALVDQGAPGMGVAVAANGGLRRMAMSGTSAAVALQARVVLGLGAAPLL